MLDDVDYAVYEGVLGDFGSHEPAMCTTGGLNVAAFASAGDHYYLVVPVNELREGSYGAASDGSPRTQGIASCLPQAAASCE